MLTAISRFSCAAAGLTAVLACAVLYGCSPEFALPPPHIPSIAEQQAGAAIVREILAQVPLEDDRDKTRRVLRILERLDGVSYSLAQWSVFLLRDSSWNAFAAPGHVIFLTSGIVEGLPEDAELAVVIAHEMGHALANHKPSIPQSLMTGRGGVPPMLAASRSRAQEREADLISLILVAEAGYDPESAVRLWKNRASEAGPSSLATHSSPAERAAALEELLPEAKRRYERRLKFSRPATS